MGRIVSLWGTTKYKYLDPDKTLRRARDDGFWALAALALCLRAEGRLTMAGNSDYDRAVVAQGIEELLGETERFLVGFLCGATFLHFLK